jgi:hypothetical protein
MESTYSKKKAGRRSKFGGVNEVHKIFFFIYIYYRIVIHHNHKIIEDMEDIN